MPLAGGAGGVLATATALSLGGGGGGGGTARCDARRPPPHEPPHAAPLAVARPPSRPHANLMELDVPPQYQMAAGSQMNSNKPSGLKPGVFLTQEMLAAVVRGGDGANGGRIRVPLLATSTTGVPNPNSHHLAGRGNRAHWRPPVYGAAVTAAV